MSSHAEAQSLMGLIVANMPRGMPLKLVWPAIGRLVRMAERRVKAIYYGEARRIEADELARLRIAATNSRTFEAVHVARIESEIARLEAMDADFYGPEIVARQRQIERLRALAIGEGA